jgi:hypothetical protein
MAMMTINRKSYENLKSTYQESVKNNISIFVFDGHELLTDYAKYLLEYLKPKFETTKNPS